MDLKRIIKEQLLIEAYKKPKKKNELIWTGEKDGNPIILMNSDHQEEERYGYFSLEQAKQYYIDNYDKVKGQKPRVAIPTMVIKSIFINKLDKILKSFQDNPTADNRIRFVIPQRDNESEEYFDYIEVVLSKDYNKNIFTIITSAFSEDGNFLKRFQYGRPLPGSRVMLERYNYSKLPTIYI